MMVTLEQKTFFDNISDFTKFLQDEYLTVYYNSINSGADLFNIPYWFLVDEKQGDLGITQLANELLSYVRNYVDETGTGLSRSEDLIKFLSYEIYQPEDIDKLLDLRMKFLIKESKIDVWLNFLAYVYYQNNIVKSPPKIKIVKSFIPNSLGASYDILGNTITFYTNHYHMHIGSSFIKISLIHEMAHYLYTVDGDVTNKEKLKKILSILNKPHGGLVNLMEDIRIDNKISSKYSIIKNLYIEINKFMKEKELKIAIETVKQHLSHIENENEQQRKQLLFNYLNSIIKMYDMLPHQDINEYISDLNLNEKEQQFVDRYLLLVENVKHAENIHQVDALVEEFLKKENLSPEQPKNTKQSGNNNNSKNNEGEEQGQDSKGSSEKDNKAGSGSNDIRDLIEQLIKKADEIEKQNSIEDKKQKTKDANNFDFSDLSDEVEQQVSDYFEKAIEDFLKDTDALQRIKQYEDKQKENIKHPSYGSPVKIDLSQLTSDERYFLLDKKTAQVTDNLEKAYITGLKDGFDVNIYVSKKLLHNLKGNSIDLKKYVNLMGKLIHRKPIDTSDLKIFKTYIPYKNEHIPTVDCVVDTSGSMHSWHKTANEVLAYIMGLQDALIDKNIFKLNIYLIRGEHVNLCLDLNNVLKKLKLKDKDKFTLKSVSLLNNISYTGPAEGLTGYLETAFHYKKPLDYVLVITDAHFVNVKDWDLLNQIKNMPHKKRPHMIGLYVTNYYKNVENINKYMKIAFDEYYASSIISMFKICKKVINEAVEIQLKNINQNYHKKYPTKNY